MPQKFSLFSLQFLCFQSINSLKSDFNPHSIHLLSEITEGFHTPNPVVNSVFMEVQQCLTGQQDLKQFITSFSSGVILSPAGCSVPTAAVPCQPCLSPGGIPRQFWPSPHLSLHSLPMPSHPAHGFRRHLAAEDCISQSLPQPPPRTPHSLLDVLLVGKIPYT